MQNFIGKKGVADQSRISARSDWFAKNPICIEALGTSEIWPTFQQVVDNFSTNFFDHFRPFFDLFRPISTNFDHFSTIFRPFSTIFDHFSTNWHETVEMSGSRFCRSVVTQFTGKTKA
jgi:hypothetical protein